MRFRIDGILYDIISPPKRFQPVIISRVKIMAGLNIAEKRLPQDGRIRIKLAGKDVDIRVSTVPTAYGERVVMRLLDRSATHPARSTSSASTGQKLEIVDRLIHQTPRHHPGHRPDRQRQDDDALRRRCRRSTRPTRTSSPSRIRSSTSSHGVGQIQVNPKIELTFASGLRSILRQDPDVIMVGEIRDAETAEIAIQAALTGHLVFSTLHTNDSCGAVTRLVDMGIEPFLVVVLGDRRDGAAPGAPRLPGLSRSELRPPPRSSPSSASPPNASAGQHRLPGRARAARSASRPATAAAPASTSCWSSTTRCAA